MIIALVPAVSLAAPLTTTHYQLEPNVNNSFGGSASSASYGLVDSGGEAALGFGSTASYKLGGGYVAQLERSLQIAVLPTGVTRYYPLDTGAGVIAYDSSATANNAVGQGTPTWVSGQINQALTFNGSTQYLSSSATVVNPTVLSIELWFKSNTAQGGLLAGLGSNQTGASGTLDRVVYLDNAGHVIFGVDSGTKHTITTTGTYANNAWHHVAATLGSGGMALYVDGVAAGTDANTASTNLSGYWRFGYDSLTGWPSAPTSSFYAGAIDEIKLFSRALTSTEALNEFTAGQAGIVSAQTIPQIVAGTSSITGTDIIARTDAGGYNLAINQDHDLLHTDAVTTIPALGSAIASPALWTEGSTKGLGFSLIAGTGLDAKWGTNPNYKYAALPASSTSIHTRSGQSSGQPDATTLQFRLDVSGGQKAGKYSNTVTISATALP